jgi:hypothetical protein
MKRAVNLTAVVGSIVLALAAFGCARPPEPCVAVNPDAVATTELSAAVVETDAPKVSKQQYSVEVTDPNDARKDAPHQRPRGGFSGYK